MILQVLTAIPFIAEFSLACTNGEKPSALYADIDGVLVPVTQSLEGDKYQVQQTIDSTTVRVPMP